MMKKLISAVALSAAFAMPSAAATVVNGSFEMDPGFNATNGSTFANLSAPGGQSWGIFSSLPGWTAVPVRGPGIEIQTDETVGFIDAQDGEHYVELDSTANAAMEQTINFTRTGSFLLSFFYSPRTGNAGTNGIDFSIASLTGNISGPGANPLTAVGTWTLVTAQFVISQTGNYNLRFAATGNSDSFGGFVDNVSIAAVPVPAAGFLLFGALGGLVALRRRKTA